MSGRGRTATLAGALAAAALLCAVAAVLHAPIPLVVHAPFDGAPALASVRLEAAAVVPIALVAAVAGASAAGLVRGRVALVAQLAADPIALFLVALANGVADAAALVLVYATTAGGVLLRIAQTRGGDPLPIRLAAVLGVVPWGVVAFTQIGGLLTGTPPAPAVRILTVVVLAAAALEWVVAYRRRDAAGGTSPLVLVAVGPVLLAVLVLATV